MVDTTALMTVVADKFVEPARDGHELLNMTVVAFLIEHEPSGQKLMFDLGVRKDFWNLPPILQQRLGRVIPSLRVDKDTTEILQESKISLKSISSVVWSHYHWDHTGTVSLFPPSTSLVVGPGVKSSPNLLPGYPQNPNSPLNASDIEGRTLVEIDFTSGLNIGEFRAHDYFGDGSFYLLDTPGHCLGHMCALARTTPEPNSTFVFLGGDICHFPGAFRPTPSILLPDHIPTGVLDESPYFPSPCPCSLFTEPHPLSPTEENKATPFYNISTDPSAAYADPPRAQASVNALIQFDASPSVCIFLSHDTTLLQYLPTLNNEPESDLNDWKKNGWKEKCHWGWLNEMPRGGKPGRKPIVDGFWRDGQLWDTAKSELAERGKGATGTGL
ncbi:Uncharacterized protein BP5553_09777 [Venustampulla echinocandica]|uniref:Metallo-beta-lactamase domain-containing protein n=1 Tax=Venustampulla echinocandica TaxID=2656787 RepID=A0A370TAQ2_9HELO|nr:Uncharacterized protein BP5553_09777 [Venustampulla echinocandica]RDL30988.1 Uncharacterized protein BP5553_09777 [Venustampulla echinocandica]